jgi:hypothetical protein
VIEFLGKFQKKYAIKSEIRETSKASEPFKPPVNYYDAALGIEKVLIYFLLGFSWIENRMSN